MRYKKQFDINEIDFIIEEYLGIHEEYFIGISYKDVKNFKNTIQTIINKYQHKKGKFEYILSSDFDNGYAYDKEDLGNIVVVDKIGSIFGEITIFEYIESEAKDIFKQLGFSFIDDEDYHIFINKEKGIGIDFKLDSLRCLLHIFDIDVNVDLIDEQLKRAIKKKYQELKAKKGLK